MSELGILQDADMTVPGLNISKSWQHINYERTGHIKKGRPPSWYTTLANHISQNPPSITKTLLSNVHKLLSHKKNKLQWTYNFSTYGELSFGRIIKKSHPTKNSQAIFYSHWIPLDDAQDLLTIQDNNNARLVQCTGCDLRIKGSVNFPTTAPCIIR